jgi:drug/metabolite transporter, DME family
MRRTGSAGVLGGLGLVLAFAGAIFAIQTTTIANAVLLFAASPFLAALLGWLVLGEPVRRATWAAIAVALAGMAVMVGGGISGGALPAICSPAVGPWLCHVHRRPAHGGGLDDMMPAVIWAVSCR